MTAPTFLDEKTEERIRKAHRRGQKSIVIDNRKFAIKKVTKKVTFTSGGEQHKRNESWLLITRADGGSLPMAQIEVKKGDNLRSQF
jgi:hypothetical protein